MPPDLAIGLDSSTTATKAIAWTREGYVAAEGRATIPLDNPAPNHYEQNPSDWWSAACESLRQVTAGISPERIAGLAISNQRETFVPLDENGFPVRPAIIWLDQRCIDEVPRLAERVGRQRIHEISGKPVDVAPVAYRIAWMKRNEPGLYGRTALFTDVHGYLTWKLTGNFRTSWASADPLGLFDLVEKVWSPEVLKALELSADRLPVPMRPGSLLGRVTPEAASESGLPPGTPVYAGGGDGQAAGLGVNSLSPERAYLNLGTAAVEGVYSAEYRTGLAWRTMGSCSGDGYYYETSLRTGTFLIDWFVKEVCHVDPESDSGIYSSLEQAAARVPIGSDGLLLLPYWGAVMTPYWDKDARGAMIGFLSSHGRGQMYRALLEGVALEQVLITGMIEKETGVNVTELVAIGGGAASDLWCHIIADATGKTVKRSGTVEASCLGAGICAAVGAGLFSGMEAAAESMSGNIIAEIKPDATLQARYAELLSIYRDLYPQLRRTFTRLSEFTSK